MKSHCLRERGHVSPSRCLSVCLSVDLLPSLSLSLRPYISHCHILSVTLLLCLSFHFSLCWFIFISLTYSSSPPLCFVAHSPTRFSYRLAFACLFLSIPRSVFRSLFVCASFALQDSYFAFCFFSFVPLSLYPAVCLSVSLSLCVSRYSCRDFLTC